MAEIVILDGGMGQELVARHGEKPTSLWASQVMLEAPELVRAVHDDYFAAGAEVATTNTYALHHDRLESAGIDDQFQALHRVACEMAVAARDANGSGLVAGSLGPLGWSYRPDLAPPSDEAAERYAEICRLHEPYVDLFICETMCSVDQARGCLAGAQAVNKPVWLALSVDDDEGGLLRSGEPLADYLLIFKVSDWQKVLIGAAGLFPFGQALHKKLEEIDKEFDKRRKEESEYQSKMAERREFVEKDITRLEKTIDLLDRKYELLEKQRTTILDAIELMPKEKKIELFREAFGE